MKEELYKEVGAEYRFFLGWRHASLAGLVVIVAGSLSMSASIHKDSPSLAFLGPLLASPFGVILWWIDVRTRDLYHAAIEAGKGLEAPERGFFTILSEKAVVSKERSSFSRFTQSGALTTIFWLSSIGMLVLAAALYCSKTNLAPTNPAGKEITSSAAKAATASEAKKEPNKSPQHNSGSGPATLDSAIPPQPAPSPEKTARPQSPRG